MAPRAALLADAGGSGGHLTAGPVGEAAWEPCLPEYSATNAATSCACFPTTMFSGMIAPE